MSGPSKKDLARTLLERHGRTFASEAGIRVERDTPAPLFQLLCLSLLLSARISSDKAVQTAKALRDAKLTTPRKMADATWQQRVDAITATYTRYDESTARMLGDTAELLLDRYGGDLRALHDEVGADVDALRERVQEFKGIGEVGADIFVREVQAAWTDLAPFADGRVLDTAQRLGLGSDAQALARLVPEGRFAALAAALIRVDLADDFGGVRAAAGA